MTGRGGLRVGGSETGVALAILVWFLAALSLLVAGIVMQVRIDSRLSGLQLAIAKAEAAGDGAIQLALADYQEAGGEGGRAPYYGVHQTGELKVAVVLTPLSGLIDLNEAPEELLSALFSFVAGLDNSSARELAASVVEWRGSAGEGTGDTGGGEFEVLEDLMKVAGVNREIFEAVQGAVHVSEGGSPAVDWLSAPVPVLQALGGMSRESAVNLALSRFAGGAGYPEPPVTFNMNYQQAPGSKAIRADALSVIDNTVYLRRRGVEMEPGDPSGLPWQFFRTEAVRAVPGMGEAVLISGQGDYARD